MKEQLETIYTAYKLKYKDNKGNELPFSAVLGQIYIGWDKGTLQNFMNNLLEMDLQMDKEDLFGDYDYVFDEPND